MLLAWLIHNTTHFGFFYLYQKIFWFILPLPPQPDQLLDPVFSTNKFPTVGSEAARACSQAFIFIQGLCLADTEMHSTHCVHHNSTVHGQKGYLHSSQNYETVPLQQLHKLQLILKSVYLKYLVFLDLIH
jgi:hypothetical protein